MAKSKNVPSRKMPMGGRKKRKKGYTIRKDKYYFPLKEKTVLIRAVTRTVAEDIFRRWHGSLDAVIGRVRMEIVAIAEPRTKDEHARGKNSALKQILAEGL